MNAAACIVCAVSTRVLYAEICLTHFWHHLDRADIIMLLDSSSLFPCSSSAFSWSFLVLYFITRVFISSSCMIIFIDFFFFPCLFLCHFPTLLLCLSVSFFFLYITILCLLFFQFVLSHLWAVKNLKNELISDEYLIHKGAAYSWQFPKA